MTIPFRPSAAHRAAVVTAAAAAAAAAAALSAALVAGAATAATPAAAQQPAAPSTAAQQPAQAGADWRQRLAQRGLTLGAEVTSVPDFSFDGYEALDDEHLVVHMGGSRSALLTAARGCIGLDDAHVIAYRNLGPTLTQFDRLRVAGADASRQACRIESIRLLKRTPK